MALLYRAIWTDSDDVIGRATAAFNDWVVDKYPHAQLPSEGSSSFGGGAEVDITKATADNTSVIRAALYEEGGDTRWTTTLLSWVYKESEPVLWVDLEYVTNSADYSTPEIAAPRLVRKLIDAGLTPSVGHTSLRTYHRIWLPNKAAELAAELADPRRTLPAVVFSAGYRSEPAQVDRRALYAARRLAGVATVDLLTPDAIDPFIDALGGREFGVWGGAARVYMPGLSPDDFPFRHFVLPASRIDNDQIQRAGSLIASRLATAITSRRPPPTYRAVRTLLSDRGRLDLEQELLNALTDLDAASSKARYWEDQYISAAADLEEAAREIQVKTRQLTDAYRYISPAISEPPDVPDDAESCTDAAKLAQTHLSGVRIPDEALRDLESLDDAIEARAWGATAWRALRALDAYSRSDGAGGFWQWCSSSASPLCWPATPKKLSMSESESVMNSERLRACRCLPIDPAVDPSGQVEMVAHMKIAEGGGPLAPRIYFYDDTGGPTGRVHVGYFGPHKHMPNKSTN